MGSEMCIRDSRPPTRNNCRSLARARLPQLQPTALSAPRMATTTVTHQVAVHAAPHTHSQTPVQPASSCSHLLRWIGSDPDTAADRLEAVLTHDSSFPASKPTKVRPLDTPMLPGPADQRRTRAGVAYTPVLDLRHPPAPSLRLPRMRRPFVRTHRRSLSRTPARPPHAAQTRSVASSIFRAPPNLGASSGGHR